MYMNQALELDNVFSEMNLLDSTTYHAKHERVPWSRLRRSLRGQGHWRRSVLADNIEISKSHECKIEKARQWPPEPLNEENEEQHGKALGRIRTWNGGTVEQEDTLA
jgi:hypothetical protein